MGSSSIIAPPNLKDKSTPPFRIGDIKHNIGSFNEKLLSWNTLPPVSTRDQIDKVDASHLRLATEIEYLAQLTSHQTSNTCLTSPQITAPPASQPAQQPSTPATGNIYESCVTELRQKRSDELRQASTMLFTLQASLAKRTQSTEAPRTATPRNPISVPPPSVPAAAAAHNTINAKENNNVTNNHPANLDPSHGINSNTNTNDSCQQCVDDKVQENEVVIRIAVYLPHAPSRESEEWLVLGSQRLTALRDVIYCLTKVNAENEEKIELEYTRSIRRAHDTTHADSSKNRIAKPSGYFYIEGTFYVDSRDEHAVDYSETIREYNRQHNILAPPHPPPAPLVRPLAADVRDFSVDSMQDRKFEDIWIRLGRESPSLYCHQGGCEHLMVFVDVRKHDPRSDPMLLSQYPFRLSNQGEALVHRRRCEVCNSAPARKLTWDDKNTPHNPFYWCRECFNMMHYGDDGRVLYTDYKVFPYSHDYQMSLLHTVGMSPAKKRKMQKEVASTDVVELVGEQEDE